MGGGEAGEAEAEIAEGEEAAADHSGDESSYQAGGAVAEEDGDDLDEDFGDAVEEACSLADADHSLAVGTVHRDAIEDADYQGEKEPGDHAGGPFRGEVFSKGEHRHHRGGEECEPEEEKRGEVGVLLFSLGDPFDCRPPKAAVADQVEDPKVGEEEGEDAVGGRPDGMGKVHRGDEADGGEDEGGAEADQALPADRVDVHEAGEGDGQRHWHTLGEEEIKPCRLVCRNSVTV